MYQRSSFLAALLAVAVALGSIPGLASAQPLSDEAFQERLSTMQERAREASAHYEAGETQNALDDARYVRDQFTFNGTGASPLEQKIREESALAIADRVKAQASRYVSAIDAGEPVDRVNEILADLEPSLNRLVLVAQGQHVPVSERELKSEASIRAAADEVHTLVDDAVALYAEGDPVNAQQTAEEAFFTFETNGLGPDVATVDEPLENEVENKIQNFDTASQNATPGLADLIANNASLSKVQAKAEEIHTGVDQIVELLLATKPPTDLGDANKDGSITIVDALVTAQASLGIRSEEPVMDANQDDAVTIVDALMIAQAALGIRTL